MSRPANFAAATTIAMLSLVAGCSSWFGTSGVVLDGEGKALRDATVGLFEIVSTEIPGPEFETFQGVLADGSFEISISTGAGVDHFLLLTKCPGYHDDERRIHRDVNVAHRIVLSRLPVDGETELQETEPDGLMQNADLKPTKIASD